MLENSILILALAGACGALLKDIIEDGFVVLPKYTDGKIFLGFLGGVIIGGATGYLIDGNPVTAFLSGYSGKSVIENLLDKIPPIKPAAAETIKGLIRMIAQEEKVNPDLAVRVAKCESELDPKAVHLNADGSKDRGLFQINSKHHPEVSDDLALDPLFSTKFFCDAFKGGNLGWWNATKSCWEK